VDGFRQSPAGGRLLPHQRWLRYVGIAYDGTGGDGENRDGVGVRHVGLVLIVSGAMHFFNLYVFSRMRRRRQAKLSPPFPPDAHISIQPGRNAAPVTGIMIVYDAACGLCTRTTDWIRLQNPLVDIGFIASDSSEARRRFPGLPSGELAAGANTGEVWLESRLDRLSVGNERLPRPRVPANQPVAFTDGEGGIRYCL
jgi:hypothetical protein